MKLKHLSFPFLFMFLIAVAVKFYQCLYIEPNLPSSLKIFNLFSYAIILVFFIFFIIMNIMAIAVKECPEKYIMKRNIPAGLFALLSGISINLYSVLDYIYNSAELTTVSLTYNCVNCVIGFILIVMAISCFAKKNVFKDIPLIALAPSVLACLKLIYTTFFSYPNLSEISDQTFKMLTLLFWTLFIYLYAKLLSNFQTKNTIKRTIIFGMLCFGFAFVYTAPELIFNFNQLDVLELTRFASYLLIGLFAVCISFELMMKNKMDQVHSYNEEDFTTFEPNFSSNSKDDNTTKLDEQINFNEPAPRFFENLVDDDIKKDTPKNNVEPELDADFLVDDILNNNHE